MSKISTGNIAAIIARLKVTFPNYNPQDLKMTAEVWFEILGDLDAELVKAAVMQYSGEAHEFAPSVGTVRDYAMRIQATAQGVPDAYEAYGEVCAMPADMVKREIAEEGGELFIYETSLKWSHPLIAEVAGILGFPRTFPTESAMADRAQFFKTYDARLSANMREAGRLPSVAKYIEDNKNRAALEIKKAAQLLSQGENNGR